jgi:hypothetical protein
VTFVTLFYNVLGQYESGQSPRRGSFGKSASSPDLGASKTSYMGSSPRFASPSGFVKNGVYVTGAPNCIIRINAITQFQLTD